MSWIRNTGYSLRLYLRSQVSHCLSHLELLPQQAILSLDAELGSGEALDPAASYAESYGQIKTRVLRTCSNKKN